MSQKRNGLNLILSQEIVQLKVKYGDLFDLNRISLSEIARDTGISIGKLKTWKKNGFSFERHYHQVNRVKGAKLARYTDILDGMLKQGVHNSELCFRALYEKGYTGSLSTVKRYIHNHQFLIPPVHKPVEGLGSRARRYETDPGRIFQMDWGFTNAVDYEGLFRQLACFAMICHHCGKRYIEFFPNARQECLFIGMIHAFRYMGVPESVMTDNMKSIVTQRDPYGNPLWNSSYESFMKAVGFKTILCRPRHPYTKGKVERLVEFVKGNFLPGRQFGDLYSLNDDALAWCEEKNHHSSISSHLSSDIIHQESCGKHLHGLEESDEVRMYESPLRHVMSDGFVSYENHKYGIPCTYTGRQVRICRHNRMVMVYSSDGQKLLVTHKAVWSMGDDSVCEGQFAVAQPEEFPTEPVRITISQSSFAAPQKEDDRFSKFDFAKEGDHDE